MCCIVKAISPKLIKKNEGWKVFESGFDGNLYSLFYSDKPLRTNEWMDEFHYRLDSCKHPFYLERYLDRASRTVVHYSPGWHIFMTKKGAEEYGKFILLRYSELRPAKGLMVAMKVRFKGIKLACKFTVPNMDELPPKNHYYRGVVAEKLYIPEDSEKFLVLT